MYIKLTRFDNRPVWLNASFIVTVEPRRDGNGAVVVPIGDGLDYDVRESPEQVLKLLEGAPEPSVVPVAVSDCLTNTPSDVSSVSEPDVSPKVALETPMEDPPAEVVLQVEESGRKPRKRATRKAKPAAEKKPRVAKKAASAPTEEAEPPPPPKFELSDDQVARLRKMAPKSLAKVKNTLATQFPVADVNGTVAALAERGVFKVDGNHIIWSEGSADV